MQSVSLTCNDYLVVGQLNKAQKFNKGEVVAGAVQQQIKVFRKETEKALKQTPLKQTGKSKWSKKYGKMTDNIRQSSWSNVERYHQGKVTLMLDARLRWFEKGYTFDTKRNKTSFKGLRFLRGQVKMSKQRAIDAFNTTLNKRLQEEFNKIQGK